MQSRGRARTKNGRLIVILNSKCKDMIKKLEDQEGYLFESLQFECRKSEKLLISIRAFDDTNDAENEHLSIDAILKDVECDDEEYDYDNIDENINNTSASFKLFLIADFLTEREIQINVRNSLMSTSIVTNSSSGVRYSYLNFIYIYIYTYMFIYISIYINIYRIHVNLYYLRYSYKFKHYHHNFYHCYYHYFQDLKIDVRLKQASFDIDAIKVFDELASTVLVNIPTGSKKFLQNFSGIYYKYL
jgi:hypothetical protein